MIGFISGFQRLDAFTPGDPGIIRVTKASGRNPNGSLKIDPANIVTYRSDAGKDSLSCCREKLIKVLLKGAIVH
jgi:hypothetical protein